MTEKDKHIIDEQLCRDLLNFEVDPPADSWEKISEKIDSKSVVIPMRRRLYWIAAAAVIALLVGTGTLMLLNGDHATVNPIAGSLSNQTVEQKGDQRSVSSGRVDETVGTIQSVKADLSGVTAKPATRKLIASAAVPVSYDLSQSASDSVQAVVSEVAVASLPENRIMKEAVEGAEEKTEQDQVRSGSVAIDDRSKEMTLSRREKLVQVSERSEKVEKRTSKKWSFGMGGGSLSASFSDQPMFTALTSSDNGSNGLLISDALSENSRPSGLTPIVLSNYHNLASRTDINHHRPITVGVSLSRRLNDRFYLQTGLNYSYIASDWNAEGAYDTKIEQKLHFIGIPLSLTYRLAQWNRLMVYASGGGMAEMNIVGHQYFTYKINADNTIKEKISSRMTPLLWSVNGGLGVSYPIIKFVSAYAEFRASYYFDNGSDIETIHSEKPFNLAPQIGIRFGF